MKIPKWLSHLLSSLCLIEPMMNSCWLHFGWAIISFPSFCSFVIHYLIYSFRPIRVEGGEWAGQWWVGGACRLWFSAPWTAPRFLPLDCRETTITHNWMILQEKPPFPDSLVHGTELLSLFAALLSLPRLSCIFAPPPHLQRGVKPRFNCIVSASSGWFLPPPCFSVSSKEHGVKVQSGLTATKHRCLVRRLCPDVGFLCKPGSGLHFRLQGEDEVDDQWPPVHALTWHICIGNAGCNPHISLI